MTKDKNLVSVIMATNRVDKYLSKAIESILNQTYKNLEFIIVANGPEKLNIKLYIEENFKNSKIIIITSSIPQLSNSLNIAIDHSKGNYLARMDADDISHPERIEKQINHLLKNNIDIVGCDINLIDEDGNFLGRREYPKGKSIYKKIYFRNPLAHNTVIYKKSSILSIRGYNSGFNSEDYDLWLRAYRQNLKIENINEFLLDYRIHKASTQGNRLGYAEACGYILREALLTKNLLAFFAVPVNILKFFLRGN